MILSPGYGLTITLAEAISATAPAATIDYTDKSTEVGYTTSAALAIGEQVLMASPGSQRNIDSLTVFNGDSIAHTLSVGKRAVGGGLFPVHRCVLQPYETLSYSRGGWGIFLADGSLKGQAQAVSVRGLEPVTSERHYYVNVGTGSAGNSGVTAGSAWPSIQFALDWIGANLYVPYNQVLMLHVADGLNAEDLWLPPVSGGAQIYIEGNTTTPANCIIRGPGGNCMLNAVASRYNLAGFYMDAVNMSNYGCVLQAIDGATVVLTGNEYKITGGSNKNVFKAVYGSTISLPNSDNFLLRGSGAHRLAWATEQSLIDLEVTDIAMPDNPTFTDALMVAEGGSIARFWRYGDITGTVTGKRYDAKVSSTIDVWEGDANALIPGTVAGTVDATSKVA